jgi:hypothetical protein
MFVHIFSKDPSDRDEIIRHAQLAVLQSTLSKPGASANGLSTPRRAPAPYPLTPDNVRKNKRHRRTTDTLDISDESLIRYSSPSSKWEKSSSSSPTSGMRGCPASPASGMPSIVHRSSESAKRHELEVYKLCHPQSAIIIETEIVTESTRLSINMVLFPRSVVISTSS